MLESLDIEPPTHHCKFVHHTDTHHIVDCHIQVRFVNQTFLPDKYSDVNIPNATSISYSVFQDCYSLKSVNLQNVTTIDSNAFGNCVMLTDINISSATSIGRNCFDGCYSLTQVNLPSVTNIGNYAFQNCFSLNSLVLGANQVVTIPTTTSYDPFQGTLIEKGYGYIYVPDNLVDNYKSSENANWLKYANRIKPISEAVE